VSHLARGRSACWDFASGHQGVGVGERGKARLADRFRGEERDDRDPGSDRLDLCDLFELRRCALLQEA